MSLATTGHIAEGFDDVTVDVTSRASDMSSTDISPSDMGSETPGMATVQHPVIDPLSALSHGNIQGQDGPGKTAELNQKLDAILQTPPKTWKPVNIINANKPVDGAQNYKRIQGDEKLAAANAMEQQIQMQLAETLRQMDGAQPSVDLSRPGNPQGSTLGSAAGKIAADIGITAVATAFVGSSGAIAATVAMAAKTGLLEGKGTLVTFDQPGQWVFRPSSGKSSRRSKDVSSFSDYGSSPEKSAPTSTGFQQKLNNGPGFGRHDYLADANLARQLLGGISEIKIPEDSPAGMAVKGMKENAQNVLRVMDKQSKKGIELTVDNALMAKELGMDKNLAQTKGPAIPTFVM